MRNYTNHDATLPLGNIDFIEVPITNEKPYYYQVHDINSLVHNVAHTYHPDLIEPIVSTSYLSQYIDDTSNPSHSHLTKFLWQTLFHYHQQLNLFIMFNPLLIIPNRALPFFTFSKESPKIINKFNFQFSDLTDTEYITLCILLVDHKHCYAKIFYSIPD